MEFLSRSSTFGVFSTLHCRYGWLRRLLRGKISENPPRKSLFRPNLLIKFTFNYEHDKLRCASVERKALKEQRRNDDDNKTLNTAVYAAKRNRNKCWTHRPPRLCKASREATQAFGCIRVSVLGRETGTLRVYCIGWTSEWMMQVIICLRTTRNWKWKIKERKRHTLLSRMSQRRFSTFALVQTHRVPSQMGTQQSFVASFTHRYKVFNEGNSPSRESLRRLTRSFIMHDWMH